MPDRMGLKAKNRSQGDGGIRLQVLERGDLRHTQKVRFKLNHRPL